MGWISKPVKHKCTKPIITADMIDWVWECDTCFAHWIVKKSQGGYVIWKQEREGNEIIVDNLA